MRTILTALAGLVALSAAPVMAMSATEERLYVELNVPLGDQDQLRNDCEEMVQTLENFDLKGPTKRFAEDVVKDCRAAGLL